MGVVKLSTAGITNYQKYDDMMAGNTAIYTPGAFELAETVLITDNKEAVVFENINTKYGSVYQHLQLRMTSATTNSSSYLSLLLRFNDDTSTNYADHTLYGNGSAVLSAAATSQTAMVVANCARSIDSAFSSSIVDILDPFETTKNKTIRSFFGQKNSNLIQIRSGLWINTAAVTSIRLTLASDNLRSGSRFSLYGLRSA
jgi:hypothetical protein